MNLHHLFVHMLVCDEHLLFNRHGMNIKVKDDYYLCVIKSVAGH
jgi:hypothetical protein